MKAEVLGTRPNEYDSKKTGKHVTAMNVYVAYPALGVTGRICEDIFISDSFGIRPLLNSLQPGDFVNIERNSRGFLIGFSLADA